MEGVRKNLPGVPPFCSGGGWEFFSVAEERSDCGSHGGNILNGEHHDKIFWALAGDGSGGGKAKGGGLRIAAAQFFHEHVICLQIIIVLQGSKNNKRPDKEIPAANNGDDPSWVCLPVGWRGWLER